MASLNKIASTSPLMEVDVKYEGKRYKFNLFDETQVKEVTLNTELKKHASSYYFLLQLRNKLERQKDLLEAEEERTLNRLFVQYKNRQNDATGRPNSDDMAKALALSSKLYKEAKHAAIIAKHDYNSLRDAVRAYENRKEIMQSLSANLRKEK